MTDRTEPPVTIRIAGPDAAATPVALSKTFFLEIDMGWVAEIESDAVRFYERHGAMADRESLFYQLSGEAFRRAMAEKLS